VHSTISSSTHEMSLILAQFQLQEQVKKKPWKTMKIMENNERTTLDPNLHLGSPNHEISFELHFLVQANWISFQNGAM
jgi:hypothetical protein